MNRKEYLQRIREINGEESMITRFMIWLLEKQKKEKKK